MVSLKTIKWPLLAIPQTSFLPWTFFAISYSKSALTFYSVFLGCGENIDPQKEVSEETLTPQNEAKAGKVQVKKTVLMPNWNYSEISKVNSGKFFSLYANGKSQIGLTFDFIFFSPQFLILSIHLKAKMKRLRESRRLKKFYIVCKTCIFTKPTTLFVVLNSFCFSLYM